MLRRYMTHATLVPDDSTAVNIATNKKENLVITNFISVTNSVSLLFVRCLLCLLLKERSNILFSYDCQDIISRQCRVPSCRKVVFYASVCKDGPFDRSLCYFVLHLLPFLRKMKLLIAACLLVAGACAETCYNDVNLSCGPTSTNLDLASCNALYGGYHGVATQMQAYANLHIERSYEYLLTSTYFNNYQTNRAGFTKLFRKLSDEAWNNAIELMKHITKRGGKMDFNIRRDGISVHQKNYTVELHELGSLSKALDVEKDMAERAFNIHREATRNRPELHDAEIAQYLEEEFIERQANTIRSLAGHTTDLKKFIADQNGQDMSLALYLFDEYLSKVA